MTTDPILIYGAGYIAPYVFKCLLNRGVEVRGFVDRAKGGQVKLGLPVHSIQDAPRLPIVIGLLNSQLKKGVLESQLIAAGFPSVMSFCDFYGEVDRDQITYLWLGPTDTYAFHADEIKETRALFRDPQSLSTFDATLNLRLTCDAEAAPEMLPDQYFSSTVPQWTQPLRWIDCGALDGDTIRDVCAKGIEIEEIAAFDPDPVAYDTLLNTIRARMIAGTAYRFGLHSSHSVMPFDASEGKAHGIIKADGEASIKCVTIDDTLPGFMPNLITMDIEGSELEALKGGLQTIRRHRPGMAISLYHTQEHLWEIPLWVKSLALGYKFFLRSHSTSGFDLVLYCLPL